MSKKIFLTGATGFVGSYLYPKLIKLGYEVYTEMRHLHSQQYYCVIHLAAVTHTKCEFDAKMIESNILLTSEIFKTSARVLYASSCSAAHLTNPYAYTKVWAEYCGSRHSNSLGLRFHNIYGKNNNKGIVWFLLNSKDRNINIRGADLVRDYVYVEDVVDYIVRCIKEYDFREILKQHSLQDQPKRNIGVVDVGTGVATTTRELVEKFMWVSGKYFEISTSPASEHEPERMVSNNIVPHLPLDEGLRRTVATQRQIQF